MQVIAEIDENDMLNDSVDEQQEFLDVEALNALDSEQDDRNSSNQVKDFLFTMFLLTRFLVCLSGWNFVIDFKLTSR